MLMSQKEFVQVLGMKLQSQTSSVNGELGTRPIKNRLIVNMIRFWIKVHVVNMNDICKNGL